MKIPNIFKPDDVEDKTNSLLNQPETIELEDLILKDDSGFFNFVSQGDLPAKYYPSLDESKIDEAVYVNYGSPLQATGILAVDIIKFRDKEYLVKNMDKVKVIIAENNSGKYDLHPLIKNEYVILIYAESKKPENYSSWEEDPKTKIISFYKQKFGFKEVEQ